MELIQKHKTNLKNLKSGQKISKEVFLVVGCEKREKKDGKEDREHRFMGRIFRDIFRD